MILITSALGTVLVKVTSANPVEDLGGFGCQDLGLGDIPKGATSPTIVVISPQNNTQYSDNNINLEFSVSVACKFTDSKIWGNVYFSKAWIYNVQYKADWLENNVILYDYQNDNPDNQQNNTAFSNKIQNIPEGKHSIAISTIEKGTYLVYVGGLMIGQYYFYMTNSANVSFIVPTNPIAPIELEPSIMNQPILTYTIAGVVIAVIVIAATILLLYHKKHVKLKKPINEEKP